MYFRVVSDVHLEHWLSGTYTAGDVEVWMGKAAPPAETDKDATLILAGDISQYPTQRRFMLEAVAPRFKQVIYVAGNHEHWGNLLEDWSVEVKELEAQFEGKILISRINEVRSCELGNDTSLIYATMWAPYGRDNPVYESVLRGNMDCKRIKRVRFGTENRTTYPKDFQDMYTVELKGIEESLKTNHAAGKKSIVVTHHVPSLKMRLPGLSHDAWDDMFISPHAECFMHEDWAPKFWFFGHTHKAWDLQIGNTRCISNPFGYPGEKYMGWVANKTV
jgi:predicted phosphodiesterase